MAKATRPKPRKSARSEAEVREMIKRGSANMRDATGAREFLRVAEHTADRIPLWKELVACRCSTEDITDATGTPRYDRVTSEFFLKKLPRSYYVRRIAREEGCSVRKAATMLNRYTTIMGWGVIE